jgi:hypothetical protein
MANLTGFNNTLTIEGTASIGNNFLNGCTAFNNNDQPLTLKAASIGNNFMKNCTAFNKSLTIEATSIGYNFLNRCSVFNRPVTLKAVTSIGNAFLNGFDPEPQQLVDIIFNNTLTLPSTLTSIGDAFLSDNPEYDKPLTIPASVNHIGSHFLVNCDSLTSTITVNCPVAAFSPREFSDYMFSTNTDNAANAASYITGITIAGDSAEAVKARFPNRTTSPYRNLK